jgi:hypothetical protein
MRLVAWIAPVDRFGMLANGAEGVSHLRGGEMGAQLGFRADFSILADGARKKSLDFGPI